MQSGAYMPRVLAEPPLDLVQLPWLCSAELYYDSYPSPVLQV
jgi:hypothetical protein